jgi:hypothetical protein
MLHLVQWSLRDICNKLLEFISKWSLCVEGNVASGRAVTNVCLMWHFMINVLLLLLLLLFLTAIELSLGGSTDKTSKKIYT